jgi:hypothetical protein
MNIPKIPLLQREAVKWAMSLDNFGTDGYVVVWADRGGSLHMTGPTMSKSKAEREMDTTYKTTTSVYYQTGSRYERIFPRFPHNHDYFDHPRPTQLTLPLWMQSS